LKYIIARYELHAVSVKNDLFFTGYDKSFILTSDEGVILKKKPASPVREIPAYFY
jgi:hypothetical protein